jgi:hypothetical protein
MSIQTRAMRETEDRFISAIKHDDGSFSGIEFVNHPTPSGCTRYLPTISDNRKWPSKKIAKEELAKMLNNA